MIDGSELNLLDIYGEQPVYLKLWATYCIPCRVQMPGLERIYQKLGRRIQVVAVNAGVNDDSAKVKAFVARFGMHMPVGIDDGSLGAWLKMQATPVHLVIGRDGRIIYAGHQDGPKLNAALQRAIDSPASGAPIETTLVKRLAILKVGDTVPTLDLRSSHDAPVQFRGGATDRPRALFFTATWCEDYLLHTQPKNAQACKRVREAVDRLSRSGKIEWLGIVSHLWTAPENLTEYVARTKQPMSFAIDTDGTAFRIFGIQRFPAVALIDKEGKLSRIAGPDAAVDELVRNSRAL